MSELQTPDEGTETTEQITPQVEQEPVAPQAPTADETKTTSTEEVTEPVSPEPQPELVPKEKFVASQRESILNAERVKVRDTRIEQLTKQDTPTDEAMRQLYPEWDQLDDYNKRVIIRQETIAMQQSRTLAKQQEIEEKQRLEDELDNVVETNPKLRSKEAEFKRFARNSKNRGIPAETLAKAFLFDAEDETTPMQTSHTDALPTGSGGPREPIKPNKISLADAAILRDTNYKEYKRQLLAGNIEEI
jgi:hypothetical protein